MAGSLDMVHFHAPSVTQLNGNKRQNSIKGQKEAQKKLERDARDLQRVRSEDWPLHNLKRELYGIKGNFILIRSSRDTVVPE